MTHKGRRGFTLIELMLVVGIVSVLAATALPAYQNYTYRAKQAEGFSMLAMAKNAQVTHFANADCFLNVRPNPPTTPSVVRASWDTTTVVGGLPCSDSTDRSFEDIGVRPAHNQMWYQYECRRTLDTGATENDFECSAYGDLDGDSSRYELVYGTDNDGDGATVPTIRDTISYFPNEPTRISVGVY